MAVLLLGTLLLLACVLSNAKVGGHCSYPPFLFSLLWLGVFLAAHAVGRLGSVEIPTLGTMTIAALVSGVFWFTAGGWLAVALGHQSKPQPQLFEPGKVESFLLGGPVVLLPLFAWRASELVAEQSAFGDFYRGLRHRLSEEGGDFGVLTLLFPLAVTGLLVGVLRAERDGWNPRIRGILCLLALSVGAYAVLLTGRVAVVLAVVVPTAFLGVRANWPWRRQLRGILAVVAVGFLVVFASTWVLQKDLTPSDRSDLSASSVLEGLGWMVLGPSLAFDHEIKSQEGGEARGCMMLRGVSGVAVRLGLVEPANPPQLRQDYVDVPFAMNQYTAYLTPFRDFGLLATSAFTFLVGILHTATWVRARRGSIGSRWAYALLCYPLVLTFYSDQYSPLVPMWCQYLGLFAVGVAPWIRPLTRGPS